MKRIYRNSDIEFKLSDYGFNYNLNDIESITFKFFTNKVGYITKSKDDIIEGNIFLDGSELNKLFEGVLYYGFEIIQSYSDSKDSIKNEVKEIITDYYIKNGNVIEEPIDKDYFYTKNQVDDLIDEESKDLVNKISTKQDNLVDGENIKTINTESILGKGDIFTVGHSEIKYQLVLVKKGQTQVETIKFLKFICGYSLTEASEIYKKVVEGNPQVIKEYDDYESALIIYNKRGDNTIECRIDRVIVGGEVFNDYVFNKALGNMSHSEGTLTTTASNAFAAHTEGKQTTANATGSHAEGFRTVTENGVWSHAEGQETKASSSNAHSEGYKTIASNKAAHSEGNTTQALGEASHAEGYKTTADSKYSHAEGYQTLAYGLRSHAEGLNTEADTDGSHAEGGNTIAEGDFAHSEGSNTDACDFASHAEGSNTYAEGKASHAEGQNTQALGEASHAEGHITKALANYSHSEGYNTIAKGLNCSAHSEGRASIAYGDYSHCENGTDEVLPETYNSKPIEKATADDILMEWEQGQLYFSAALGEGSHCEGWGCISVGDYSHAEGESTKSMGTTTHSEGFQTVAYGWYSHAEGFGEEGIPKSYGQMPLEDATEEDVLWEWQNNIPFSMAYGEGSHCEGAETLALGSYSHVEGEYTAAIGECSHAEGYNTIAKNEYEHAQGQYNVSHKEGDNTQSGYNTISSIGVGSAFFSKNAIEVCVSSEWNQDKKYDSKVFIDGIGEYKGTDIDQSEDLATVINNMQKEIQSLKQRIVELEQNTVRI